METISRGRVSAFKIPTDSPESDGTLEWTSTTLVVVELEARGQTGLGYTYADLATATLIHELLLPLVQDQDPLAIECLWQKMVSQIRGAGRPGVSSMAISAVDMALWDLKAKLFALPLVDLLGPVRDQVLLYGSGGFTSYSLAKLQSQLGDWAQAGFRAVKMKIGRDPSADPTRVAAARQVIGPRVDLMIDANGAYSRKQALHLAEAFVKVGVSWFEEPVIADDLEGLSFIRQHCPPSLEIAAGEYGYQPGYFKTMLDAQAVDVMQADATRCEGVTGFLKAAVLCEAARVPLSAHTAPSIHTHLGCAIQGFRHVEYFHDHARIEKEFFDGAPEPLDGMLQPDRSRAGIGLEFKRQDALRYAA